VALDELLHRFPERDLDHDGRGLAPTTTVRGWAHLPTSSPAAGDRPGRERARCAKMAGAE